MIHHTGASYLVTAICWSVRPGPNDRPQNPPAHEAVSFVPHLGDKCGVMGAHRLSYFLFLPPAPIEHLSPIWRTPPGRHRVPSRASAVVSYRLSRRIAAQWRPPAPLRGSGSGGSLPADPTQHTVRHASTSTPVKPGRRGRRITAIAYVPRPSPQPGHTTPSRLRLRCRSRTRSRAHSGPRLPRIEGVARARARAARKLKRSDDLGPRFVLLDDPGRLSTRRRTSPRG